MDLASIPAPRRHAAYGFFSRLPYWLLVALLLGVLIVWRTLTNDTYAVIFSAVSRGLGLTIYVTLVAYAGALVVGLLIGIARVSKNRILFMSRSSAAHRCLCCCSTLPSSAHRRSLPL